MGVRGLFFKAEESDNVEKKIKDFIFFYFFNSRSQSN